jgi:hypothetical protein
MLRLLVTLLPTLRSGPALLRVAVGGAGSYSLSKLADASKMGERHCQLTVRIESIAYGS